MILHLAAFSSLALCAAGPLPGDQPTGIVDAPLLRALADAADTDLIPVYILMREQVPADVIRAATATGDRRTHRSIVVGMLRPLAQRSQQDLLAFLARSGAQNIRPLWITNAVVARVTPDAAAHIARRPDVARICHDTPIGAEVFPDSGPRLEGAGGVANSGCGLLAVNAPQVWSELGITGQGITVAIIDTGCCITHPDLVNQIWTNPGEIPGNNKDDDDNGFKDDVHGWNFANDSGDVKDNNGHGTHTTGIVAGDGTNGLTSGMAPDVSMMILEFWNNLAGQPTVWESMQYAVDNGADVISASIGWTHKTNPDRATWRQVCENTIAAGLVVVYAAGNEGECCGLDNIRTPADVPDVIAAGATDCSDLIAGYSSRGPVTWTGVPGYDDWPYPPGKLKPTLTAPGQNIWSTSVNCSTYVSISGTSMAAPHVAGAAALILQANPALTHAQVKQLLEDSSQDLGDAGADNTYGAGRIDAYRAVHAALSHCDADCDRTGSVDIDDFLCFQTLFGIGDLSADCDGNGTLDIDDFLCFQMAYSAGCP